MVKISNDELKYLTLLSRNFPDIATASTEIINLEAIQNLPKGTEHFLADLHGEYEAFQHVLRNASGTIKRKVKEIFNETLGSREQKELCTLLYYPEQKLELVKQEFNDDADLRDWYFITINRLVRVCRDVSSKYTRSKVHKALPDDFSYIIQELLHESSSDPNKQAYVDVIVRTIISTKRADDFIIALCNLTQQLTIDRLHILGDVYDRGLSPDKIMDLLCNYHNFDIQWGNHDILWMGAASGNDSCIANVIRIAMRYGNQAVLEDGYGINLLPLATFAMECYENDPCTQFQPSLLGDRDVEELGATKQLIAQMHKAIAIIQFKLEAATIMRRPDFEMNDRLLLNKIDFNRNVIKLNGKEYELTDSSFPTVDPEDPFRLTPEEEAVVAKLHKSFISSEKLRKHINCLFRNGGVYSVVNGNLLFHASIPMNENGTFKDVMIQGQGYQGEALMKKVDSLIREAYFGTDSEEEHAFALDYVWYLWCGKDSPSFDKDKMATFERYFIADKETYKENKGHYYTLRDNEQVCDYILDGLNVTGQYRHIINGHIPVRTIKGETPVKANGKMMVIDGGFSKAYQPQTGIAGYTLVYHSRGFQLVQHEPFSSITQAVEDGIDIKSTYQLVEMTNHRMMVKDTDKGAELRQQIEDLKLLLYAYRSGLIKERKYRPITNKR
ncbi:MAG: fructose-1,6-bisphosphatase [Muribaculaceae bacterium]|nr:fructose-1,6-bisphosphatase [Muribaculaceae bacterium]